MPWSTFNSQNHGPMTLAGVQSKIVALLLLNHCLMFSPLFEGVLYLFYALLNVLPSFVIILTRERERERERKRE